mgnify:CR=1 FL=1
MKIENLKLLVLDKMILLTQIEEVSGDLGMPDCKLTEPFVVEGDILKPWLMDLTNENVFMIHSDKILTITEPNGKLKSKYEDLLK